MPPILIDTNVLLRSADPAHTMHRHAIDAVNALRARSDRPCLVPQNIVEFRAVCTRPVAANGLGISQALAKVEIARLRSLFPVFDDVPGILTEWERLVDTYGAIGRQNHEARIVAAMNVHGISTILTFDRSDFNRYVGITVIEPQELLAPPVP